MADQDHRPQETRNPWDEAASSFDDEPDHGLRDAEVLRAWTEALTEWLPARPSRVLDAGCGTGSLSVVVAGLGHEVTAVDYSP